MEQDCVNAGTVANLCDKIQKLESERDALKAHIEELTVYEYREIGESGWMRCTKEWFEYCQKSPELDTRKRIKSLAEHDAEESKRHFLYGYHFCRANGFLFDEQLQEAANEYARRIKDGVK